jgi:hypothetical protein
MAESSEVNNDAAASSPTTSQEEASASSSSTAPDTQPTSICAQCSNSPESLKQCLKCHSVAYCNKDCQKANFKVHKKVCASLAQEYTKAHEPKMASRSTASTKGARDRGLQKWQVSLMPVRVCGMIVRLTRCSSILEAWRECVRDVHRQPLEPAPSKASVRRKSNAWTSSTSTARCLHTHGSKLLPSLRKTAQD